MPTGQGWGRCQVRLTVLTWLRRQKRRGRRQEKRYLPHRITQEKHQLSRVMLTPGVGASSAEGWGRRTGCSGRRVGIGTWGEEKGKSLASGGAGFSAPQERTCPAPSSGRRAAGAPRQGPDVPPSPPKPLREMLPPSGISSAAPTILPSA